MLFTEFHGTDTVQLTAPAADVFELLVDVDRLPQWNAHVHHVIERPDQPLTSRVEWVIQMRAMGKVAEPLDGIDRRPDGAEL